MKPAPHWVEPFLEVLATTGNVTVSANQAGIDRDYRVPPQAQ